MNHTKKYPPGRPFKDTLIETIGKDIWRIVLKYVAFGSLMIPISLVNALPIHNMGCKNKSSHNIVESCISYHKSLKINETYYCRECSSNAHFYIKCQGLICCYCNNCIKNNLIKCDQCVYIIDTLKKTPPYNPAQIRIWHKKTIIDLLSENNYGDHLTSIKEHKNCILCSDEIPYTPMEEIDERDDNFLTRCVGCGCKHNSQRKNFRINHYWILEYFDKDGPNNPAFLSVGLHWVGQCIKRFYICQFCIKEPELTPMLDNSITMLLGKIF